MNPQTLNKYDSEFCGSLPIHLINVVQPYGALIVIDRRTGKIIQVSENVAALTGRSPDDVLGTKISDYLDTEVLEKIKDNSPHDCRIGGRNYQVILHGKPSYFILEINLESATEDLNGSFVDVYQELKHSIAAIESAGSVTEVARTAAAELKKASGFDKVMIYRFDEHWNGFVMAEEREEEMESYLGFTFPASDIPRQAREMYFKNAYRLIPDRNHEPVRLYPFINPATEGFIDLSDCNVRGVAKVHLEYLKNMNVVASMSTRIIKDDKLWGLIACHNKTPIKVNYKICAVFELLSGIISRKTSSLEDNEKHALDSYITNRYASLVEETYRTSNISESLFSAAGNVLELFNAGGVVFASGGQISKRGTVPDAPAIEDLMLWLNSTESERIFHTDNLSKEFDYATDYKDVASGLLAIPVNPSKEQYVLLFRPEVMQVINWGGDPENRINFEPDMKTYHPRFSFKLWQEKVSGISMPWRQQEVEAAENLRQFIRDFMDKENASYN